MGWEAITPRAGVRSAGGGVTCAWRGTQKRLAVTLGAEVCRKLGLKAGSNEERFTAEIDGAQGRLRVMVGKTGAWKPRPKDGCVSLHLPLDFLTGPLPSKPSQSVPFEVDPVARSVTLTLPAWALPSGVQAARAAAQVAASRRAA